jgi:hypothetical protein
LARPQTRPPLCDRNHRRPHSRFTTSKAHPTTNARGPLTLARGAMAAFQMLGLAAAAVQAKAEERGGHGELGVALLAGDATS